MSALGFTNAPKRRNMTMKTTSCPNARKTTERPSEPVNFGPILSSSAARKISRLHSEPTNSAPIMSSSAARRSRCPHCGHVAEHERFARDTRDCKSCDRRFHTRPTPLMVLADVTPFLIADEMAAVLRLRVNIILRFIRLAQLGPDACYDRARYGRRR
jgi:hypothetical protein